MGCDRFGNTATPTVQQLCEKPDISIHSPFACSTAYVQWRTLHFSVCYRAYPLLSSSGASGSDYYNA